MEMKKSKFHKIVLGILGLLLTVLGLWRLIDPVTFFANSDILLNSDSGLLNEARGTGGVVVGFGLVILFGVFNNNLTFTSTVTAVTLFYGFALARLIGFVLDGNVVEKQTQGALIEIVFGTIALYCLLKFRTTLKDK